MGRAGVHGHAADARSRGSLPVRQVRARHRHHGALGTAVLYVTDQHAAANREPVGQHVTGYINLVKSCWAPATTVSECVTWLGYTYLYVRMQKSPSLYGVNADDLTEDPTLLQ